MWIAFFLALLSCLVAGAAFAKEADTRIVGLGSVVDGDTLDVGAVRVRLNGIDAPEAGQSCKRADGHSWQCGTAATNRLVELVEAKEVECRARDRDQYGRVVADCSVGAVDVNATLVDEGLAWAFVRYSKQFIGREALAKAAHRGIWQGTAQAPWDYRADRWSRAAATAPRPGCPIKGNINQAGERIYHTPWSPWYDRTKVNQAAGERWFCDETEAIAAGWRAARWH